MILHWENKEHTLRTLLDTGCSIAIINQQTVERLGITRKEHDHPIQVENFIGEIVKGAGQWYTESPRLQHRKHFTKESFEILPMEKGVDILLPFQWITNHPPQGVWTMKEVRFNSARCLKECTRLETNQFSRKWDESVLHDTKVQVIGHVLAIQSKDPLEQVLTEFWQYLGIIGKEAADALPEHRPYDYKIDLKEGATVPWGPIYPLSEVELQILREWLSEMERTGKIKRSTSPVGSPILFVAKLNRYHTPVAW